MWKRYSYNGGICDPLIITWPAGFAARGEIRHQYHHAIDIMPTVLDCIGIQPPEELKKLNSQRYNSSSSFCNKCGKITDSYIIDSILDTSDIIIVRPLNSPRIDENLYLKFNNKLYGKAAQILYFGEIYKTEKPADAEDDCRRHVICEGIRQNTDSTFDIYLFDDAESAPIKLSRFGSYLKDDCLTENDTIYERKVAEKEIGRIYKKEFIFYHRIIDL
jgi:hypothetical protein